MVELGDDAQNLGLQLVAEEDVLRNVEGVDQAKALMQTADAGQLGIARGAELQRLAVDFDATAIGRLRAGQRLDQGRFAGAVVSHQGKDFAVMEVERDVVDRPEAAIALVQPDNAHQRRARGLCAPLVHRPPKRPDDPAGSRLARWHISAKLVQG